MSCPRHRHASRVREYALKHCRAARLSVWLDESTDIAPPSVVDAQRAIATQEGYEGKANQRDAKPLSHDLIHPTFLPEM
jgi:hypothetical protein